MKKPTLLVTAMVSCAAVLTTACTPAAPMTSSSTPAPERYSCGDALQTCSAEEHAKYEAQLKLVDEATGVYRRYAAEDFRLQQAGGAQEATPELLATASGNFLKKEMEILREVKAQGLRVEGTPIEGDIQSFAVSEAAGVGLDVCADGRQVNIFDRRGMVGKGAVVELRLTLSRRDGVLKIVEGAGSGAGRCA